jgi:hypothetical protein
VSDGGLPFCNVPENATFLQFLEAGKQDCVYDFGDAGSRTFNVSMNDESKENIMPPVSKKPVIETEPAPEPIPVTVPMLTVPPVQGVTTATVGVADNAISEVKSLIPADGHANMITVALAAIGVAGGGAAIKLYQNMSKNKHEQAMKKLELEERRSEKQDDQHQQCNASRVALETKIASLTARLEELAARKPESSSLDLGDFNPEELEERLKKIEASLKPAKGKKK